MLFNMIISILTSFSLVYALTSTLAFEYSPINLILVILVVLILYALIFANKYTLLLSAGLAGFSGLSWFIYAAYKKVLPVVSGKIFSIFLWLSNYVNGYEDINNKYALYITLMLIAFISLFVYIVTLKSFNFYILLGGGILLFTIQFMLDYLVSYQSFYMFLFLMLIYYLKHIYLKNSKREQNNYLGNSLFTIFTLPICLVVFSIAFYIPKSSNPVEWEWLDKKINSLYDYFNDKFHYISYDYFTFSSTGFGKDEGRLGGKVKLDKTPVLEVEAEDRIYLRGGIRDFYTGNSWELSVNNLVEIELLDLSIGQYQYDDKSNDKSNDESNDRNGDRNNRKYNEVYHSGLLEPLIGAALFKDTGYLSGQNSDKNKIPVDDFIKISKINVKYLNLKTKTIFSPANFFEMSFTSGNPDGLFLDNEGVLSSERKLGKGFQYTLKNLNINYKDEAFVQMLKKSYIGLYKDILNRNVKNKANTYSLYRDGIISPEGKDINISSEDIEKLAVAAEQLNTRYLQLPDTVPERVKELAISIASNENNNYDKVKAIEVYLASNYPYTLKPRPTPNGRDFTDYFLFVIKEGYCVYYATAMTVMLRSIGIPARYVEGYMLPPAASSDNKTVGSSITETSNTSDVPVNSNNSKGTEKIYNVTNENAHAWVEVYFEGFGWIPFEPTSPFLSSFYSSQSTGTISSSFAEDPFYIDYLRMLEMYDSEGYTDLLNPNIDADSINTEIEVLSYKEIFSFLIAVMLILFAAIVSVNLFRNKNKLAKIRKMDPGDSIISMAAYYLKVYEVQGTPILKNETPAEFVRRIEEQSAYEIYKYENENFDNFKSRVSDTGSLGKYSGFKSVMDIFILARYSSVQIKESQKDIVIGYYKRIIAESRDNLGLIKYFGYRYLLGRF